MPDRMKIVWIVSEGSPGHISQSVGLVEAMKAHVPLMAFQVFGRLTARGWLHPLIRSFMGRNGRPLSPWLLRRVAKVEVPNDVPLPDLIVSSGGKSAIPARSWAQYFNVPFVFIGLRKPYPTNWFHTVITHVPMESQERNAIFVELLPTPVTPTLIGSKGILEKGTWAMIIGGASRSHRFMVQDWLDIAKGMRTLAQRENIQWLLTTSRRTGPEAERILRDHLDPFILKDAIWWSEQPRRELYNFMARSESLFVTQDSVTMVTEAVSAGKPVIALRPKGYRLGQDNFKEAYLERLERLGRIIRLSAGELLQFSPQCVSSNSVAREALGDAEIELLRRLGWLE